MDDIPSPINCLYGAFIYSTKPLARIKGIEFKSESVPDVVTALLSYKDIPDGGQNIGSKTIFGSEPLFADELTCCAGQPVAFVVIYDLLQTCLVHSVENCISFLYRDFAFNTLI